MPHKITPITETKNAQQKKVVVVGAGPGGLEAARVAAERGHQVKVIEAAPQAGGQVLLCAKSPRRRDMIGIIDWRMAQCAAHDVEFNFNVYAEADDVLALNPDVVIIATGGMPHMDVLQQGNELLDSTWDIIAGDVAPKKNILIYDNSGDHPALQAAEVAANLDAKVEVMTYDRTFAPEIMGMNLSLIHI